MYKFFCFKIEIKIKAELYMSYKAMTYSTKYILWIVSQSFYCWGLFCKEYLSHQEEYIIVHFLDNLSNIYC